jgi:hypothetical protein
MLTKKDAEPKEEIWTISLSASPHMSEQSTMQITQYQSP